MKKIKNTLNVRRIFRQVTQKITKNKFLKMCLLCLIVLATLAFFAFEFEKDFISYKIENGKQVVDKAANITNYWDSIWWGFVTATTTGYGDFYPISKRGRLMGILLMFLGTTIIGLITGSIASYLVEKQLKEERGLKDLKLKNHFIICGWKRDMAKVLLGIMEKNKSFLSSEIVLINTATPEDIQNLKSDTNLIGVNFIHGDYIDESVLRRANIKQASKVLILADRLTKGSVEEIDSRTVMTIITIKALSKSIYTAAELLDTKYERYLRFSNCDEVILTSEYNRSLIANASAGSGISHVISELLNVNADVTINTINVPKNFIGKQYNELFNFFLGKNRSILIGILENTGNFFIRKKLAIQEAQKTPDISKLVDNLKNVKTLVANQPVINPLPEYVIKEYSKAIIIEGRM